MDNYFMGKIYTLVRNITKIPIFSGFLKFLSDILHTPDIPLNEEDPKKTILFKVLCPNSCISKK